MPGEQSDAICGGAGDLSDAFSDSPQTRVRQRGARLLWLGAALVLALAVWMTSRPGEFGAASPPLPATPAAVVLPAPSPTQAPPVSAPASPATVRPVRTSTPRPSPKPTPRPSYWIRFGPTHDLEVLGEMVDRLARAYAVVGRIQTQWRVRAYRVVSGPVPLLSAAEERQALLAAVGLASRVRAHPQKGYLLDFGEFRDAAAAEERARAVRARGFIATVAEVRTASYTVLLGPLSEEAALAVARSLQASGFSFSLSHRP